MNSLPATTSSGFNLTFEYQFSAIILLYFISIGLSSLVMHNQTIQEERGDVEKYEDQQSEKSGQRSPLNSTTINERLKEEV